MTLPWRWSIFGCSVFMVCAKACSGFDGCGDLEFRGSCVAIGDMHSLRDEFAGNRRGVSPYTSDVPALECSLDEDFLPAVGLDQIGGVLGNYSAETN
jgi:hypothetical protein